MAVIIVVGWFLSGMVGTYLCTRLDILCNTRPMEPVDVFAVVAGPITVLVAILMAFKYVFTSKEQP